MGEKTQNNNKYDCMTLNLQNFTEICQWSLPFPNIFIKIYKKTLLCFGTARVAKALTPILMFV